MRIPDSLIPSHVTRVQLSEVTNHCVLAGPVSTGIYDGRTFAIKAHDHSYQNSVFPAELRAFITLGKVPHVVELVGVVVQDSPLDAKSYICGMLLQYCKKGNLKTLLKYSNPPVTLSRKKRWATQIAHGLQSIHGAGLVHSDLRCENVVVDEFGNAHLIDITNGEGFTEGWNAIWDDNKDPRRDIYSLGVTLWEVIHDGADSLSASIPLSVDGDVNDDINRLVGECLIENAAGRSSLADIYVALGHHSACGCLNSGLHAHVE